MMKCILVPPLVLCCPAAICLCYSAQVVSKKGQTSHAHLGVYCGKGQQCKRVRQRVKQSENTNRTQSTVVDCVGGHRQCVIKEGRGLTFLAIISHIHIHILRDALLHK